MSSPSRQFKSSVYEHFARIGKAAASPRRLELLDLLCQGPRTVEELARAADMTLANASQHLQVLRRAGLVDADRSGLYVTYRVADEGVPSFFLALRGLAEARLPELRAVAREYFEDRDGLEPVEASTLLARARRGEVVVVDVRPASEYRHGHVAGAISIPVDDLESRLAELPDDREIVAYCRGPFCVMSARAVELLRAHGYDARRLEDSVHDWRGRGHTLAAGDAP